MTEILQLDFSKICRFCMKEETILMPMNFIIYSSKYEVHTIGDMIQIFDKIKFTENDGLPENVCLTCFKQLNRCYEFYRKCLESNKLLLQTINNTNIFDNIISSDDYFKILDDSNLLTSTVVLENYETNDENKIIEISKELEINNFGKRPIRPKLLIEPATFSDKSTKIKNHLIKLIPNDEIKPKNNKTTRTNINIIKKHVCTICQRSFFSKKGMIRHKISHKDIITTATATTLNPLICNLCNREFPTKLSILRHMKHHKNNICFYCNSGFLTENTMIEHINIIHLDQTFPCIYCLDKHFLKRKLLLRHQRDVHKIKENLFYCGICDNNKVGYISTIYLQRHIEKYHQIIEEKLEQIESNEEDHQEQSNDIPFCQPADEITIISENQNINLPIIEDEENSKTENILDNFVNEKSPNINLSSIENVTFLESEIYLDNENVSISTTKCINVEFLDEEEIIDNNNMLEYFLHKEEKNQTEEPLNIDENKDEPQIEDSSAIKEGMVRIRYLQKNSIEPIQSDILFQKSDIEMNLLANRNKNNFLERYKCPKCNEKFSKQFNLTKHLAHEHNEMCLICNECGASFNRICEWELHRKIHQKENFDLLKINFIQNNNDNNTGDETILLDNQNMTTTTTTDYEPYKLNGNLIYNCQLCKKIFHRKINLQKHKCANSKNQNHNNIVNVKCTYCDEKFLTVKKMCIHRKIHLIDNMLCSLCDKKFTTIAGLKYHLKTHTGVKAFTCHYCYKKFTASTNLNSHIRIHAFIKPYSCIYCEQKFATLDHLKKHTNQHTNERKYLCVSCGKRFLQHSHLTAHMLSHNNIKQYQCNYCQMAYTSSTSLKKHLLGKHSIK